MAIYLTSDFFASITKLPFETRKQLVQMANYDLEMKIITRNAWLASGAMMARDVSFRSIILGMYFATTNIEHRPVLKYSIPQIVNFAKQRREMGYDDNLSDMQGIFMEYHSY